MQSLRIYVTSRGLLPPPPKLTLLGCAEDDANFEFGEVPGWIWLVEGTRTHGNKDNRQTSFSHAGGTRGSKTERADTPTENKGNSIDLSQSFRAARKRAQNTQDSSPPPSPDADFVHLSPSRDLLPTPVATSEPPILVATTMHDHECMHVHARNPPPPPAQARQAPNVFVTPHTGGLSLTPAVDPSTNPSVHEGDDVQEDEEAEVKTPEPKTRPDLLSPENIISPDSAELVACSPDQELPCGGNMRHGISLDAMLNEQDSSMVSSDSLKFETEA